MIEGCLRGSRSNFLFTGEWELPSELQLLMRQLGQLHRLFGKFTHHDRIVITSLLHRGHFDVEGALAKGADIKVMPGQMDGLGLAVLVVAAQLRGHRFGRFSLGRHR